MDYVLTSVVCLAIGFVLGIVFRTTVLGEIRDGLTRVEALLQRLETLLVGLVKKLV